MSTPNSKTHTVVSLCLSDTSKAVPWFYVTKFTMSRPELQTPPELFYNDKMSRKYNSNSRMVGIQAEISERCIELLNIPVRRGQATDMALCTLCVFLWGRRVPCAMCWPYSSTDSRC